MISLLFQLYPDEICSMQNLPWLLLLWATEEDEEQENLDLNHVRFSFQLSSFLPV